MTVDALDFRRVLAHFATGVTIVTARYEEKLVGFTANAFCSISLEPPLVMISIGTTNGSLPTILSSGTYAVNIMPDEQFTVVQEFAKDGPGKYELFTTLPYHKEATGAPILDNALAWVDCRITAQYPGGDHIILLGEVLALGAQPGTPLVFVRGKYVSIEP